jgi:tetratricopeptide (TPR) repeat protein
MTTPGAPANLGDVAQTFLTAIDADPVAVDYPYLVATLDHFREEQRRTILVRLDGILPQDPRFAEVHLRWGRALFEKERYSEAVEHLALAAEASGDAPEALEALGTAELERGRVREGTDMIRRAAAAHLAAGAAVRAVEVREALGSRLARKRHFRTAAEEYAQAVAEAERVGDDSLTQRLKRAWSRALRDVGRPEKALEVLANLAANTHEAAVYPEMASLELLLERPAEAVGHLVRALELQPGDDDFFGLWTSAFAALPEGEREAARRRFDTARPGAEGCAAAWFGWGRASEAAGKLEEALDAYERAEAAAPDFFILFAAGNLLMRMHLTSGAVEKYRRAEVFVPEDKRALGNVGDAFVRARAYEDAVRLSEYMNSLPDRNPSPRKRAWKAYNRAYTLELAGRVEEAIDHYWKAEHLDPLFPYATHNLATIYWRRGAYLKGWQAWDRAIQIYERGYDRALAEGDKEYFLYFGQVLGEFVGDYARAERVLKDGLNVSADHAGLHAALAAMYAEWKEESGQSTEDRATLGAHERMHIRQAEALLEAQATTDETSPEVHQQLGDLCFRAGRYDRAVGCFERAISLDGESARAHNGLGSAYFRLERYSEALKEFRTALRHDGDDLNVRTNLAETYLKMEQPRKALEEYRQVFAIAPGNVDTRLGLAQTCLALASKSEPEPYRQAIDELGAAIELIDGRRGSMRRKPRTLAEAHYLRGYARAQLWEAKALGRDETLLRDAAADFRRCAALDPSHVKAEQARATVEEHLDRSRNQKFAESVGPVLVSGLGLVLVTIASVNYLTDWLSAKRLEVGGFSALMLSGVAVLIVGLSLPRLLKLKLAGIEIERGAVDTVSLASTPLGITR